MEFFSLAPDEAVMCEACHLEPAVDIHHIDMKGMGGTKGKDHIENLILICRRCHTFAHESPEFNERLKIVAEDLEYRKEQIKRNHP